MVRVPSTVSAEIPHGKEHINHIANKLSITIAEAKQIDCFARLQIAAELGHNRVDITNNYLG